MNFEQWFYHSQTYSSIFLVLLHFSTKISIEEKCNFTDIFLKEIFLKKIYPHNLKIFFFIFQAHIFNILKSKMTDYRDFDTLLYTCAREFDFLGWEMPYKTTLTLLMPVSLLSGLLVVIHLVLNVWKSLKGNIRYISYIRT